MREPTEEQFLKDIAGHQMTVLHNDGLYRHLHFQGKRGWNQWFDLITWPGVLTINGNMGTWTFSRVDDMFTFFRSELRRTRRTRCRCEVCGKLRGKLKINADYWAEKLQHGLYSGREGGKVWDQDTFQAHLLDQLNNHFEGEPEKLAEITAAVNQEVFSLHDGNGPHMMRHAAYEFTYEFEKDRWRTGYEYQRNWKFQLDGMDLPSGMVYSFHFIWCLYAIVWGIQQWDTGATS